MGQPAEPLIPLLLDERNADRAETDATPLDVCAASGSGPGTSRGPSAGGQDPPPRAAPERMPATGLPATVGLVAALASLAALALRRAR